MTNTPTYLQLNPIQQRVARRAHNRKRIEYNALLIKNIGIEKWESQNPDLPENWKKIAIELADNSKI